MKKATPSPSPARPETRQTIDTTIATILAIIAGLVVLGTTVLGVIKFYSPIPYWDQWDGYIGFYDAVRRGQWGILWAQHMEHRILFSRLLFLADIDWFGGVNVSTLVANLVLLGLISMLLWRAYQGPYRVFVGGIAMALLFSWAQKENLTWGFQSQCIAVYLFALLAFYQFSILQRRLVRVLAALFFAILSTISMGNGIATFAMLVAQCWLMRRPLRECASVAVTGLVCGMLYFHDYHKPILDAMPGAAAVKFAKLQYLAIFLGNPFYFVSHGSLGRAEIIGLCVLIGTAVIVAITLKARPVGRYQAFLLASLGFVFAAAVGAANSRWMLDLPSATASRYTTPTLIGYALVILLLLDLTKNHRAMLWVALAFTTIIGTAQIQVRADNSGLYLWNLAVLGQKIGLDHPDYDSQIYPSAGHQTFVIRALAAQDYQIGPYARGWLHDAGVVKFDSTLVDQSHCTGYLDDISKDKIGLVAHGWVTSPLNSDSILVLLVNRSGETVGYGVSGQPRSDVKKAIPSLPRDTGWIGFAKDGDENLDAYAYIGTHFCKLKRP